jgi:hypothetical protein
LIYSLVELFFLFLLSIGSNATPFVGASYTLLATAELIGSGFNIESFVIVVIVTALGATIGKVLIYAGAFGLHKSLQKNRNVRLLGTWLGKTSFYVALFVTAFIPILPLDDYVYIGAGANSGKLAPMLGVTFAAKLAKSAFEIILEFAGILGVSTFLGFSPLVLSILLSLVFVVLGITIYKIDWEIIVTRIGKLFGKDWSSSGVQVKK